MTVDPPQVDLHEGDTRPFGQLPSLGPFAQAAELAQNLPTGGLVTQRLPRGRRAFGDEQLAQLDQWASAAELAWVTPQQRVERVDHHLRVACAGQPPGRVAEDLVLALELLLSELLAQQTYQRSQALERLARLVDRLFIEGPPPLSSPSSSIARSSCPSVIRRSASDRGSPGSCVKRRARLRWALAERRERSACARATPTPTATLATIVAASGATMEECPSCRPPNGGRCVVRRTVSRRRTAVQFAAIIYPRSASTC